MHFNFTEEQLLFQQSVRGALERECTSEAVRALWSTDTGRSRERWAKLAEIGLLGLLVPEAHGGLGMDEVDLVLPIEETGRVALPEPVVEAAVGTRVLTEVGASALQAQWLPRVASGQATLTIGHAVSPFVTDAHVADLLLLPHDDELHAVPREAVRVERQPCNDPSRWLFRVDWQPNRETRMCGGPEGRQALDALADRAALLTAAQLVGIGQRLVDTAAHYATEREQFGRPIGSFQAVKHRMADIYVKNELARSNAYYGAWALSTDADELPIAAAGARVAATDAYDFAAKENIQIHGGMGFTWEYDAHFYYRRARLLALALGGPPVWKDKLVARLEAATAAGPIPQTEKPSPSQAPVNA